MLTITPPRIARAVSAAFNALTKLRTGAAAAFISLAIGGANAAIVFNDDFNGSALDAGKWTEYRWGTDVVTVANSTAHFASKTAVTTCGKYTFAGTGGIVVESRMAGPGGSRDTHMELIEVNTGDWVQAGDTNYGSHGLYTYGAGQFSSGQSGSGGTTTAMMEYRMTFNGTMFKIERGPTLANITQTRTITLPVSAAGKTFFLRVGTGGPVHQPADFEWVRVDATAGAVNANCNASGGVIPVPTYTLTIPANAYPGVNFANPLGNTAATCAITATGTWDNGPTASYGPDGAYLLPVCGIGCRLPTAPSVSLVMTRGDGSGQLIGSSRSVALAGSEAVTFSNNDFVTAYADNRGSVAVTISCIAPATINGTCGTANNVAVATAPTTNLCATGTATPVTGTGPWSWTCNGSGGGANASCSAPLAAPITLTVSQTGNPTPRQSIVWGDGHTGAETDTVFGRLGALVVSCSQNPCGWTAESSASWLRIGAETASGNVVMGSTASGSTPRGLFYEVDAFEATALRSATITFTSGSASVIWLITQEVLKDSDGDAVADEWERRGIPTESGARLALPGGVVGRKDLWLWIDEMADLFSAVALKSQALQRIITTFERQGFFIHAHRSIEMGYLPIPASTPVLSYESRKLPSGEYEHALEDTEVTNNVDALKAHNFYRLTNDGLVTTTFRDKAWRYVVWGRHFAKRMFDGSNKKLQNSGTAPRYDNIVFVAAETGCGSSCLGIFGLRSETTQAGTLMHELGHTLGLGHGGPYINAVDNTLFADSDTLYQPDYIYKPNYLSVMNYAYQLTGLVTTRGADFVVDFESKKRPNIAENSLAEFWRSPVTREDGTRDDAYGLRIFCYKENATNFQDDYDKVREEWSANSEEFPAGAGALCRRWSFGNKPVAADLDGSGERSTIVSQADWPNLFLNAGRRFLNFRVVSASARSPDVFRKALVASSRPPQLSEPSLQQLYFPQQFDHQIGTETRTLKLAAGTQSRFVLFVENTGFANDVYSLAFSTLSTSLLALPATALVSAAGRAYFFADVVLPVGLSVGTKVKWTVSATSSGRPSNRDSVDLEIEVVANVSDASPLPSPPIESRSVQDFVINSMIDISPDVYVESENIVVNGFDVILPIQVRDGEMSINGSAYSRQNDTVVAGDIVRLRAVSSVVGGETRSVALAVGGLVRTFDVKTKLTCSLDIDGDANLTAAKDGVLLSRYLLGFRGDSLIAGLNLTGSRRTAQAVTDFIGNASQFDAFGRSSANAVAMTDGLFLTRLLMGIPDGGLLSGMTVPSDASFTSATAARKFVNTKCGTNLGAP